MRSLHAVLLVHSLVLQVIAAQTRDALLVGYLPQFLACELYSDELLLLGGIRYALVILGSLKPEPLGVCLLILLQDPLGHIQAVNTFVKSFAWSSCSQVPSVFKAAMPRLE